MIAGEFQGARGPARTFMPVNLWDVRLKAGHGVDLRLPSGYTTAPFILRGTIRPNLSEKAGEVELVLFDRDGEQITIDAEEGSSILVLNGEPIDEPMPATDPLS